MNVNRGVALLIWNTHTHLCSALVREREREVAGEGGGSIFWFYLLCFWGIYIEEAFVGFFPLGFSQDNLCSSCDTVSFIDPVYMLLL